MHQLTICWDLLYAWQAEQSGKVLGPGSAAKTIVSEYSKQVTKAYETIEIRLEAAVDGASDVAKNSRRAGVT